MASLLAKARCWIQRRLQDDEFWPQARIAFKVGLAVSLGTLFSLLPGYSALWNNPFSLSDQVIFTILGGADLTVGGITEQIFWRLGAGSAFGALAFALLGLLGGSPIAQGIIFFLAVFLLTFLRVKIPKADIGLTFSTLACVYAVDDSYRSGNPYAVDVEGLNDLLRSWAFGAAISLAVNLLFFPASASSLAKKRMIKSLEHARRIVGWLFAEQPDPEFSSIQSVRRILQADGDALASLQFQMGWEVARSGSTLNERNAIIDGMRALQHDLVVAARNGPFVSDLSPDFAAVIRPAASQYAAWNTGELSLMRKLQMDRTRPPDLDMTSAEVELSSIVREAFARAAAPVTTAVVDAMSSGRWDSRRIADLDRATHALDAMRTITDRGLHLERLVIDEALRERWTQTYIWDTIRSNIPISTRILRLARSSNLRYAFKVSIALSCLLALLWSPTTRSFFLTFAVRNSTVPLLLALMPNLGLSFLSWTGQLGGTVLGTLFACFAMVTWRGVGGAYSIPGLFFFEWILCLAVAWRLSKGPDFLAVTTMNACAIFINIQWHQTGTASEQSLTLHLGYMLTTSAIAIALAVPLQLLIFPKSARGELRSGTAASLRQLAQLALDQVALSSRVFFSGDATIISAEVARLSAEVAGIKADLRQQDMLVDFAAAELDSRGTFNATRARAVVEALHRVADTMASHISLCAAGPVDPRLKEMLGLHNERAAVAFAEACSLALWCLGASFPDRAPPPPPAPLPSIDAAGETLLRQIQMQNPRDLHGHGSDEDSDATLGGRPTPSPGFTRYDDSPEAQRDVRRWWSLTLTLVTQSVEIGGLVHLMGPDWQDHGSGCPSLLAGMAGTAEPERKASGKSGCEGGKRDVEAAGTSVSGYVLD